jgi:hypothetical protein
LVCLRERFYYVSLDGQKFDFLMGTVQGSILSPMLYAIFVSQIFDLEFMFGLADHNYVPQVICAIPKSIKSFGESPTINHLMAKRFGSSGQPIQDLTIPK